MLTVERIFKGALRLLLVAVLCALGGPAHAQQGEPIGPISSGFIVNQGQVDDSVRFYTLGASAAVYFTQSAVVIDLKNREPARVESVPGLNEGRPGERLPGSPGMAGCAVWIHFEGAQASPRIEARGQLPFYFNYLIGSDASGWQTEIPAFAEIVYRDLWPGIDLVYWEEGAAIRYEVRARAGADLSCVRFQYEGGDAAVQDPEGSYRIATPLGTIVDARPAEGVPQGSLSLAAGSGESPPESASTGTQGGGDRALGYSTFLGGGNTDEGNDICRVEHEYVVVTGTTYSSNFPTTVGAYDRSWNGSYDVFVSKLNPTGTTLYWSTFLGGSDTDCGRAVACPYNIGYTVVGYTYSTNYPMTATKCYDRTHNGGGADGFVTQVNLYGTGLNFSTYLGGNGFDECRDVAHDQTTGTIITGYTQSTNFPVLAAYQSVLRGDTDAFLLRLPLSNPGTLSWSTYFGGGGYDIAYGLAIEAGTKPLIVGVTGSSTLPTTTGAYDRVLSGGNDGFATKFNLPGTALTLNFSTYLGGDSYDCAMKAAYPGPVIVGWSQSTNYPTTVGAYDRTYNGGDRDVVVTKLAANGQSLVWSTFVGGSSRDYAEGLVFGSAYEVYLVGTTFSSNYPTTIGAYDTGFNGYSDAFVSKLSSTGTSLLSSTFLGGTRYDEGRSITINGYWEPIITGVTQGYSFPTTNGAYDTSYNGGSYDAFVTKFSSGLAGDGGAGGEIALGLEAFLGDSPEFARDGGTAAVIRPIALTACRPNPFRSTAALSLDLAQGDDISVAVFDPAGRMVRTLMRGWANAGRHHLVWDGRDDHGSRVPAGVYLYRVHGNAGEDHKRVLFLAGSE